MDKPKFLYIVQSSSGRTLHIWAASSNQARVAGELSPADIGLGNAANAFRAVHNIAHE